MKLVKSIIRNFRGIKDEVEVMFKDFSVIVGKNDAGKSTLLKALDLFLNESDANRDMLNINANSSSVEIELIFDPKLTPIIIDEAIHTTFEDEELTNDDGYLHLKKTWDTSRSRINAELYIVRKKYSNNDFVLRTEAQLIE